MTISTNGPNHSMVATQPYTAQPIPAFAPAPSAASEAKPYAAGMPVLRVFGIGGGGCNAVERMCQENLGVVEYFGINTDAQHLERSRIANRIAIGESIARGLGVGGAPQMGALAAEENIEELTQAVSGSDMVFIAAGMGGGTGTGAAPVLARIAKNSGALTVGVVSRPFSFEAAVRQKNAEEGIDRLREHVDTLIIIPNDRLLQIEDRGASDFTWDEALNLADSVLLQGIQAIAEVVTVPGEINVDFADIKAIMANGGSAWLAIGRGEGAHRARDAAQMAVQSPLLDIDLEGAKRVLFVVTGGPDMTLKEVYETSGVIHEVADPDANIIFGTCKDPTMTDQIKVTMVASAFPMQGDGPSPATTYEEPLPDLHKAMSVPPSEDPTDWQVPSFLRREAQRRRKGMSG